MKKLLHPAQTRGSANYGWLEARYSFSFANYFDPERIQFGKLRVLNDDVVAGGMGFGKHPHKNMEIVTIPQEGALKHRDSMGNEGIVESGDIQIMSAGSGVEHSELNANQNEPVKLFQIWIFPETENVTPRYQQKKIAPLLNKNTFSTVVKPKGVANEDELWVHQQAYFNIGEFTETTKTTYEVHNRAHGIYLMVIKGTVIAEDETLNERDAIGIWDADTITISATTGSKALLIEVPMN
ncbi:pirin family protein [Marinirhabdus gelatinilytica]|uniref:Pirin N-terminal domain-containing protein n=1 Tax=Marinirhabdus gelatinilytica TaxID=1703343 RepID=A0A370QFN3_9FLAO|nr:pirin family protein [Marinirhabdus gelatinilytica]RDK87172.1 hypothetical protein C8D94_102355 [Marinirhabdus gelatinilytica]